MKLVAAGSTATAVTSLESGAIFKIDMITGGSGYTNAPRVQISPPIGAGRTATAVAITSTTGTRNFQSLLVDYVEITDPGAGYTSTPTVQFLPDDGQGGGATATAGIGTIGSVGIVTLTSGGQQYSIPPTVTFTAAPAGGQTAIATAFINTTTKIVSDIQVTNSGYGYTVAPTITIGAASTTGSGTFLYGEMITGASSLTTAFVTKWNKPDGILLARNLSDNFAVGETIYTNKGAAYILNSIDYDDDDVVNTGDEIEVYADTSILDFTEKNPFGEV